MFHHCHVWWNRRVPLFTVSPRGITIAKFFQKVTSKVGLPGVSCHRLMVVHKPSRKVHISSSSAPQKLNIWVTVPYFGWLSWMENPMKIDDEQGYPHFRTPPYEWHCILTASMYGLEMKGSWCCKRSSMSESYVQTQIVTEATSNSWDGWNL